MYHVTSAFQFVLGTDNIRSAGETASRVKPNGKVIDNIIYANDTLLLTSSDAAHINYMRLDSSVQLERRFKREYLQNEVYGSVGKLPPKNQRNRT